MVIFLFFESRSENLELGDYQEPEPRTAPRRELRLRSQELGENSNNTIFIPSFRYQRLTQELR